METPATSRAAIPATPAAYFALGLITVLQLGLSLVQQVPGALGALLVADLHISRPQLGLLTSAIWGGMLLGTLPAGLLVDRLGERRVVTVGVLATVGLILAASMSPGFGPVFSLFLVSSVGAASASPGGTRAIAAWFPRAQLGLALGIRQTGVMAGGLAAALALPPLAVAFGWRPTLRIAAAFCLLTAVAYAFLYNEPPVRSGTGPRPARIRLRTLLRDRVWLAATAYAFVFMGALGAGISYLALFLHEHAGLTIVAAAALLAVFQAGGLAGRLGWGLLSDRMGRRRPAMVAVGLIAVLACAAFAQVGPGAPVLVLAALSFALGLSILGWNALTMTIISESQPIRFAGTATGANLSVAFAAMFLVSPFFGFLADVRGYSASWLALAAWAGLGTAAALLIRERGGQ